MFSQSLIASMTIVDQSNLVMKLPIIGQEFVILNFNNKSVGEFDFTKMFFVLQIKS